MNGICPQCKTTPVIKAGKFGVMPRCQSCLDLNKLGRQKRQRENRQLGLWKGHYDINGNRYPDKAVTPRIANPEAIERKRVANIQRIKKRYYKDPEAVKRRRLSVFLSKAGLSLEWYDKQVAKGCGICGSHDPVREWCIDHDHTCCSYGNRKGCRKCIRGVLCNPCNLGIGMMRDDTKRLAAAITYLESHKTKEASP